MKKRTIFILLTLVILFGSAIGFLSWQLPKLEVLAKFYIAQISADDRVPIEFGIEDIGVRIFPPRVILKKTQILPKESLKGKLDPTTIAKIVIEPSLIDLVLGKFWFNRIQIEDANISAHLSTNTSGDPTKDIEFSRILEKVPVSEILLKGIKLSLSLDKKIKIRTSNLYLRAYNQKNSLLAKLKDSKVELTNLTNQKKIDIHIDTQFMMTNSSLSISKLKVIKEKAFIIASGNLRFSPNFKKIIEGRVSSRIHGNIKKVLSWAEVFSKKPLPKLVDGDSKIDFSFDKEIKGSLSGEITGSVDNLSIGKIQLGQVEIQGTTKDLKVFDVPKIALNLAGANNQAAVKNIHIDLSDKANIQFDADLDVQSVQLHSFLQESKIATIPVWLEVAGNLDCEGIYTESLIVKCPGRIKLKNFKVNGNNKPEARNIAQFAAMEVEGLATLTEKAITYTAKMSMPGSQGSSKGTIDFEKGFQISYDAPKLSLSELGTVAEFPVLGTAKVKGSTSGTTKWATFNIDIDATDFEFANYYFGAVQSQLNYKKGTLFFDKTEGHLDSTRYKGAFEVDLLAEHVSGNFLLPFFKMKDIQQAVFKKVDLKDRFLGSGSGQIKINSSLNTDKLSFKLGARLFKGTAFQEEFDEAEIDVLAQEGILDVRRADFKKEDAQLKMKGQLNMKLETDLKFSVTNGNLKHSSILRDLALPISGEFTANGTIQENLANPKLNIKAGIKDFIFHKKLYGKGVLHYTNTPETHIVEFNLSDNLKTKFKIPSNNSPIFGFEIDAENFDMAPMVGFSVSEASTKDYVMNFSGSANGFYKKNDFWNSEFSAITKKIAILYKGNRLESSLPTNLELKDHKIFLNDFNLIGNDQSLSIENNFSTKHHSKFSINGRINVSFFKLFAPFIKRIDGTSTVHLELHIKKNDFRLLGSSYTSDAYIEFPDFPHPFENINADILYNQNKISINSITGRMAGGKVLGNGEFLLHGASKLDMKIALNLNNINLDFPKGYKTTGNANIIFSGTQAPFSLKGDYTVSKGLIEEEFGSSTPGLTSSGLLSELLKKNEQSPIMLDLKINADQGIEVKNSLVDGSVLGKLRVFDKIESPKISGAVKLTDDSRFKFQDTEFEIADSQFEFRGQTPINPTLFMTAKTRVQDYDINMSVLGEAAQPKIQLSSQPNLTNRQIVSLLAFGSVSENLEEDLLTGQDQNQNQSSLQIGTSLLKKNPLGKEIEDRFGGLDIQFSSVIDEGTNLAVPKFTVSKKVNDKVDISANRREGTNKQTEVKVRYDLGDNLSTVFRLRQREGVDQTPESAIRQREDNQVGVDLEYKKEFQ